MSDYFDDNEFSSTSQPEPTFTGPCPEEQMEPELNDNTTFASGADTDTSQYTRAPSRTPPPPYSVAIGGPTNADQESDTFTTVADLADCHTQTSDELDEYPSMVCGTLATPEDIRTFWRTLYGKELGGRIEESERDFSETVCSLMNAGRTRQPTAVVGIKGTPGLFLAFTGKTNPNADGTFDVISTQAHIFFGRSGYDPVLQHAAESPGTTTKDISSTALDAFKQSENVWDSRAVGDRDKFKDTFFRHLDSDSLDRLGNAIRSSLNHIPPDYRENASECIIA